MLSCSCSRRANSAGVTSSGLALAIFFLDADCFAVVEADDFCRATGASERARSPVWVVFPGVVMMLVSSRMVRDLALLSRFVGGDSTITSVNSSMMEVVSCMGAGVLATVEVLDLLRPCSRGELPSPLFADRGCSDTGDALRFLFLEVMHETSFRWLQERIYTQAPQEKLPVEKQNCHSRERAQRGLKCCSQRKYDSKPTF